MTEKLNFSTKNWTKLVFESWNWFVQTFALERLLKNGSEID